MSPRSLALAAGPVVVAAVFLAWSLRHPPDSRPPPKVSLPAPAKSGSPPTLVEPPIELSALPPEDAAWVQAEAARYQAARDLSPAEQKRLLQQLASIRQFAVLERQEPLQEQP